MAVISGSVSIRDFSRSFNVSVPVLDIVRGANQETHIAVRWWEGVCSHVGGL